MASKRNHSPTNDYEPSTIFPGQPPPKKGIPDDMFTNRMAAMTLTPDPNVERVDDIDAYLEENKNSDDRDTYIGDTPELIGIRMGTTTLPFERIPGSTALRIPDFVVDPNRADRMVCALAQQQMSYQPMDLD